MWSYVKFLVTYIVATFLNLEYMRLTCHETGVIELPILGESNNANLCQFRVIFLITTHRLVWVIWWSLLTTQLETIFWVIHIQVVIRGEMRWPTKISKPPPVSTKMTRMARSIWFVDGKISLVRVSGRPILGWFLFPAWQLGVKTNWRISGWRHSCTRPTIHQSLKIMG